MRYLCSSRYRARGFRLKSRTEPFSRSCFNIASTSALIMKYGGLIEFMTGFLPQNYLLQHTLRHIIHTRYASNDESLESLAYALGEYVTATSQ